MDTPEELVAELRSIISTFRTTDFDHLVSQGGSIEELGDALVEIKEKLLPYKVSGERMQAGLRPEEYSFRPDTPVQFDFSAIEPRDFFPYSPLIGDLNPISPPFYFWKVDEFLLGKGTFDSQYCGPPEAVHGGHVAALMDELLGVTGVVSGYGGFTGTLTVRYQATTPLDEEISLKGWIHKVEERKVTIRGELRTEERICVTAEGIFIQPRDDK